MINRFGLSRDDIAPEIKRQLRKECGYGCVVCGSAIYQYEHIDPEFTDATVHDPSKMALLCGACHDKVTRRIWSKEKIKEARLVPYCKILGYSFFELDTSTSKDFIIKVGETQFINLESIIVIDDVKILSLAPPDDESNQFKVSAAFFDRNNIKVAKIVENEWQGTLNAFDIETRANLIKIRSDLRRIDLKLRLMPPNVLVIESLGLSYNGVQIRGSTAKGFTIKNKTAVLKLPKQALTIEKAPFWLCIQDGKIKLGSDSVIKFLRSDAKIEDLAGYTTVQDAEVSFVDPVKEGISFSPGVKPPEKMMKVTTRKAGGGIILNFPLPQPNHSKEQLLKVGRNAPCPCGSGKKYKKCHDLH